MQTGITRRKGSRTMAEIPADVLERLNDGTEETITLVEWLALDQKKLMSSLLGHLGLSHRQPDADFFWQNLTYSGKLIPSAKVCEFLDWVFVGESRREELYEAMATHRSDIVRAWAANLTVREDLDFVTRLVRIKRFAADPHMGVRETAWSVFRPFLIEDVQRHLKLLQPWVTDEDPNVRRAASEGSRPRGVWCAHIPELKARPEMAEFLLEPLRSDPSRYVQLSVANWINDASKSRPDWAQATCDRWLAESSTKETRFIVNRALRTLRKSSA